MSRLVRALLVALSLLAVSTAAAGRDVEGPGRPVPAPPGRTDRELVGKAARIQARMRAHLSPEGVLTYFHRLPATPERLSHDALALSDAAIWTGCYAAAQACRWHVSRDPAALDELRILARGLATMAAASGRPGGVVRNVGRPLPGEPPPEGSEPSPLGQGLWCNGNASRDQLSGVTLGWAAIGKFVEDPALRQQARTELAALARRLQADGMWMRDLRGKRTEYGELRKDVEGVPFLRNGRLAAIGLAPFVAAARLDPAPDLAHFLSELEDDGWGRALPEQYTWIRQLQGPSNVNMTLLGLLTCRLLDGGVIASRAQQGVEALRAATVGWWNGGVIACALLGGLERGRAAAVDELRAVLHLMSEEEVPFLEVPHRLVGRIPTIVERGTTDWAWKDELGLVREAPAAPARRAPFTFTRADWLFAYWLARAAGELDPAPPPGPAAAPR